MNPLIDNFVGSKRIAVVGMSRSGKKFGNMASKELKTKGYEIFPVHPDLILIIESHVSSIGTSGMGFSRANHLSSGEIGANVS